MPCYLVKALVVKCGHELGIGRRAVGLHDRQCPFLLLARCQSVAEGLPLQCQPLVGQGALDIGRMRVALALLHPGEGQHQSAAVFLLISQLAVKQFVGAVYRAALDDGVAAEDAVDDVDVLCRRAHLDGDGTAVVWEPVVRLIEPVVGLGSGPLVVERENHEVLLQGILLTDSLQLIFAALQTWQLEGGIRFLGLPLIVIDTVADYAVDVVAGSIAQMELYFWHLVDTHLIFHVNDKRRLAVTEWQRELSLVGLAPLVGHISQAYEIIEHREVGLRQHHRHLHRKRTVAARYGFTLGNRLVAGKLTYGTAIPVARIAPPPERTAAYNPVAHLGIQHGHAGIGACRRLDLDGVAVLVVLGHLVELHLECRALVLLYTEVTIAVPALNIEHARETVGGQRELRSARTIFISNKCLADHVLTVGIL